MRKVIRLCLWCQMTRCWMNECWMSMFINYMDHQYWCYVCGEVSWDEHVMSWLQSHHCTVVSVSLSSVSPLLWDNKLNLEDLIAVPMGFFCQHLSFTDFIQWGSNLKGSELTLSDQTVILRVQSNEMGKSHEKLKQRSGDLPPASPSLPLLS